MLKTYFHKVKLNAFSDKLIRKYFETGEYRFGFQSIKNSLLHSILEDAPLRILYTSIKRWEEAVKCERHWCFYRRFIHNTSLLNNN